MLPTLSPLSVRTDPDRRLRLWYSVRDLRISLLPRTFYGPLPASSLTVCSDHPRVSRGLSPNTCKAAYERFTPSNSGYRSPPGYYRGCWHLVSRGLFLGYRHLRPPEKEFTTRRPSSPTRRRCVRLSPIAQDSSMLNPVGLGTMSQSPCGGSSSQTRYRSQPWWAITPPTS